MGFTVSAGKYGQNQKALRKAVNKAGLRMVYVDRWQLKNHFLNSSEKGTRIAQCTTTFSPNLGTARSSFSSSLQAMASGRTEPSKQSARCVGSRSVQNTLKNTKTICRTCTPSARAAWTFKAWWRPLCWGFYANVLIRPLLMRSNCTWLVLVVYSNSKHEIGLLGWNEEREWLLSQGGCQPQWWKGNRKGCFQ